MKPFLATTILALGVLFACSNDRSAGKPVVDETPNGLQAVIHYPDGSPVVGARATLRPITYLQNAASNTGYTADDTSDANGRIGFPQVPQDSYRLEAFANSGLQASAIQLTWNPDAPPAEPIAMLMEITGTISGQTIPGATVRIYGSDVSTIASATGDYELAARPLGQCVVRFDTSLAANAIPLSESSVEVFSPLSSSSLEVASSSSVANGTTLDLDQYVFRFMIPPDPSATVDSIGSFPTPVKLDISQIPGFMDKLAEARAFGSEGQLYPLSLDEINADSTTAFLWILNQNTHPVSGDTLFLVFGGHTYSPVPAAAVFSSSNSLYTNPLLNLGYAGAWHFAANAVLADAGEIGYQSLSLDSGTTIDPNGVVGSARYFNGQSKIRLPANDRFSADTLTISCWIKPDAQANTNSYVLSNSDAYEFKYQDGALFFYVKLLSGTGQGMGTMGMSDGWNLVTATVSVAAGMDVFSNGLNDGMGYTVATPLSFPTPRAPLVIGNNTAGTKGFRGSIDECRISDLELSKERIQHEVWTHHPSRLVTGTTFLRSEVPFFILNL